MFIIALIMIKETDVLKKGMSDSYSCTDLKIY